MKATAFEEWHGHFIKRLEATDAEAATADSALRVEKGRLRAAEAEARTAEAAAQALEARVARVEAWREGRPAALEEEEEEFFAPRAASKSEPGGIEVSGMEGLNGFYRADGMHKCRPRYTRVGQGPSLVMMWDWNSWAVGPTQGDKVEALVVNRDKAPGPHLCTQPWLKRSPGGGGIAEPLRSAKVVAMHPEDALHKAERRLQETLEALEVTVTSFRAAEARRADAKARCLEAEARLEEAALVLGSLEANSEGRLSDLHQSLLHVEADTTQAQERLWALRVRLKALEAEARSAESAADAAEGRAALLEVRTKSAEELLDTGAGVEVVGIPSFEGFYCTCGSYNDRPKYFRLAPYDDQLPQQPPSPQDQQQPLQPQDLKDPRQHMLLVWDDGSGRWSLGTMSASGKFQVHSFCRSKAASPDLCTQTWVRKGPGSAGTSEPLPNSRVIASDIKTALSRAQERRATAATALEAIETQCRSATALLQDSQARGQEADRAIASAAEILRAQDAAQEARCRQLQEDLLASEEDGTRMERAVRAAKARLKAAEVAAKKAEVESEAAVVRAIELEKAVHAAKANVDLASGIQVSGFGDGLDGFYCISGSFAERPRYVRLCSQAQEMGYVLAYDRDAARWAVGQIFEARLIVHAFCKGAHFATPDQCSEWWRRKAESLNKPIPGAQVSAVQFRLDSEHFASKGSDPPLSHLASAFRAIEERVQEAEQRREAAENSRVAHQERASAAASHVAELEAASDAKVQKLRKHLGRCGPEDAEATLAALPAWTVREERVAASQDHSLEEVDEAEAAVDAEEATPRAAPDLMGSGAT